MAPQTRRSGLMCAANGSLKQKRAIRTCIASRPRGRRPGGANTALRVRIRRAASQLLPSPWTPVANAAAGPVEFPSSAATDALAPPTTATPALARLPSSEHKGNVQATCTANDS
eukprot:GHVU01218220.1.p2 GENE.GHVU01218220.1~~GHVU01218220.1.p2  ORF type:complete len:114 (+),score=9.25 GHVU01218220.1:381-722(+)